MGGRVSKCVMYVSGYLENCTFFFLSMSSEFSSFQRKIRLKLPVAGHTPEIILMCFESPVTGQRKEWRMKGRFRLLTWIGLVFASFSLLVGALANVFSANAAIESRADDDVTSTTYVFSNKDWNVSSPSGAHWTANRSGDAFSNNGIKVLGSETISGTSPSSFNNVKTVTLTYNTNKSEGAGNATVTVGATSVGPLVCQYSSGDGRTAYYTLSFNFSSSLPSGSVTVQIVGTANSVYLASCTIVEASLISLNHDSLNVYLNLDDGILIPTVFTGSTKKSLFSLSASGVVSLSVGGSPIDAEDEISSGTEVSVTGLVTGTVTITATTVDEMSDGNHHSTTCTVRVCDCLGDVLTQGVTGVTGATYSGWSNKSKTSHPENIVSGAIYAGNTTGGGTLPSIRLRSSEGSGIIGTSSGGRLKKVTVVWDESTASKRSLQVYGKNTAYESTADLYDAAKQGTLLGEISIDTSTYCTISGDYKYIGLLSTGVIYLYQITIDWDYPISVSVSSQTTVFDEGDNWTLGSGTIDVTFQNAGEVENVSTDLAYYLTDADKLNPVSLDDSHYLEADEDGYYVKIVYTRGDISCACYYEITVNEVIGKVVSLKTKTVTQYYHDDTSFDLVAKLVHFTTSATKTWSVSPSGVVSLGTPTHSLDGRSSTCTVTLVAAGSATITFAASESGDSDSDTCDVTVLENTVTFTWGNRGDVDCFAGTSFSDAVNQSAWTFTASYADPEQDPDTIDREDVDICLCSNSSGANPGSPLADNYAFAASDDGKYLVAFWTDEEGITHRTTSGNKAVKVYVALNSIVKDPNASVSYTLIEDPSDLSSGDIVTFTSDSYDYALGQQGTHNFGCVEISRSEGSFTTSNSVTLLRVSEEDGGTFAFEVVSSCRYLCAASSSSNYLHTESTVSDNSRFSISVIDETLVISASGTYSNKYIRYYNQSKIISCYGSSSGASSGISIYKYTGPLEFANQNRAAQTTVLEFADYFNEQMTDADVCGAATVDPDSSAFETAWDNVAGKYESLFVNNDNGLTDAELAYAKSMLQYGYATWSNDTRAGTPGVARDSLQRALKTYDYVVLVYEKTAFMSAVRTPSAAGIVLPNPIKDQSPLTTTLWIVLASGLAGLGAIGVAYAISKRRKHNEVL